MVGAVACTAAVEATTGTAPGWRAVGMLARAWADVSEATIRTHPRGSAMVGRITPIRRAEPIRRTEPIRRAETIRRTEAPAVIPVGSRSGLAFPRSGTCLPAGTETFESGPRTARDFDVRAP